MTCFSTAIHVGAGPSHSKKSSACRHETIAGTGKLIRQNEQKFGSELQEVVNDRDKTREFLLNSSMIRSRQRELEIS